MSVKAERVNSVEHSPWVPPASLEEGLRKIQELRVFALIEAVDLMAFDPEKAPSDRTELAALRCQASRALFEAAAHDAVSAIGNPFESGAAHSENIPRAYFEVPCQLGKADNSVEDARDYISTEAQGGRQKWFDVRIRCPGLITWLRSRIAARDNDSPVESYMMEPMTRQGSAGYVPLCSALLWIMTDGGSAEKSLHDFVAWRAAVARLMPLLSTGEIEVMGRPSSGGPAQAIRLHMFADIFVSEPMHNSISGLGNDDPWISCTPFVNFKHWNDSSNDQLYPRRAGPAAWTHLRVKKSDGLRTISFQRVRVGQANSRNVGGRPEEYNWEKIKEIASQIVQVNGAPSKQNKKLQSIQELIEAICEEMGTKDLHPGHPTIRVHLKTWKLF